MTIQYRWPDVKVDPKEHGLPEEFAQEVRLEYAGKLSRQEAGQKLANMRLAAKSLEQAA